MRIGLDIDGVICDFNHGYVKELIRANGYVIPPRVKSWDIKNDPDTWDYAVPYGFSHEVNEEVWKDISNSYSGGYFWRQLPSLLSRDDRKRLNNIMDDHDVYFVSKRPLSMHGATIEWMQEYFPHPHLTVLLSNKKGLIASGLQLQAFFDDKPKNLEDILRACGTTCACFLIDQPWNRDFNHPYITRISSIFAGLEELDRIVI